jgi:hypothetical protein
LSYAYTPQIWPSVFTALLSIALAIYSWRRRSVPGVLSFMTGVLFYTGWAAGSLMEYTAVDVTTKIFWLKFQAVWQLPAITAITCFILDYAWPGRWLTRRNLALLSVPPLLAFGLILADNLHHPMYHSFSFDGSLIPQWGPGSWLFLAYSFGLGIVILIALAWLFLRSPQHRWPVALILMAQVG